MKIRSSRNPRIKEVVELRQRKNRDASGLTVVEGLREIARAWQTKINFECLYVCEDFFRGQEELQLVQQIRQHGVEVVHLDKKLFSKISFGDRQEGLLSICQLRLKTFAELKLSSHPFVVVVEKVEKPGNLGAVLRTCDGAGVEALIICDGATDLFNPNVIRASIGTIFSVPVVQSSNEVALQFLKKNNMSIYATLPEAKINYTEANFQKALALVLGCEKEGLSEFWVEQADLRLCIPMNGVADSLNVSTTAAIMMYEVVRQRKS